jgi:spermidine/putrescine-binding protein
MAALSGGGLLAGCAGGGNGNGGNETNGNGGNSNGGNEMNGNGGNETLQIKTAAPSYVWPQEDNVGATFQSEYNVDLDQNAVAPGPTEVLQMFVAGDGQQFDALNDSNSMEDLLAREGALATIDKERIDNWDQMQDQLKADGSQSHKLRHDGDLYASPCTQNADGITYNDDLIEEPDSWGVLFDEQFSGDTAVIEDWANTLCWTALYLRENNMEDIDNPSNMEPEEVEAVIDFLVENKNDGQFQTIWSSYGNLINLLVNEELVATYAFLTAYLEASDKGVNLGYPALKEGHYEWNDNWHITQGAVDRGREEQWYRLANYALSPQYAADMVSTRAAHTGLDFSVTKEYIQDNSDKYDVEMLIDRFESTQERYDANGDTYAWNNMDPDNRSAYTDGWSRFLNA